MQAKKGPEHGLLHLLQERDGTTRWTFQTEPTHTCDSDSIGTIETGPPAGVCARQTVACGVGLYAERPYAVGEVLLSERWLVGMPIGRGSKACDQCLRICSWSPIDTNCSAGCCTRYCSTQCRDTAWRQHHCLLCTARTDGAGPSAQLSVHPLAVFAKHAQMAPSMLQQKPEEVLLAARMLAMCTLHEADVDAAHGGARAGAACSSDGSGNGSSGGSGNGSGNSSGGEGSGSGNGSGSDGGSGFKAEANASRSVVPRPFDQLSSYCVIGAARMAERQGADSASPAGGAAFAARSKWLGDSYRLLMASPLGRHPRFKSRCPPHVYSHCLGLIDRNAASSSALPASRVHAARSAEGTAARAAAAAAAAEGAAEGMGIYPTFSFANHSCEPNMVNAKGPRDGDAVLDCSLLLRACKPIAKGEQVTFDYLDTAYGGTGGGAGGGAPPPSAQQRRVQLREHFGFTCVCAACKQQAA